VRQADTDAAQYGQLTQWERMMSGQTKYHEQLENKWLFVMKESLIY
jgi:hypothetical protein